MRCATLPIESLIQGRLLQTMRYVTPPSHKGHLLKVKLSMDEPFTMKEAIDKGTLLILSKMMLSKDESFAKEKASDKECQPIARLKAVN
ncbi:Hypothetical predicted protein [Olea europaea subsp. europaea]|uniref:Uncharacterized protein n=1 Tax=Olea europaea subsp. europaea TaxID=158383 RepID=A0A8S0R0L1_OLEEU|nr:Hypothetical predicted protein [Olea europaea subsp. europaea]